MRRTMVALAAAIPLAMPAGRQPAPPRGLMTMHVIVETATGEPVSGLTAGDFEILEGATPRPIERFASEPPPLALVVLADVTRSVGDTLRAARGPSANVELKAPLTTLLAQLKAGDRVRLGRVAAKVSIGPLLSADAKAQARALEALLKVPDADRGGPSPIWDGIDAAVTALENEPGRRAIVVISDGMGTGNRLSLAQVADRAALANVAVSAIGFEADVTIRQNRTTVIEVKPEVLLQGIATFTGGLYRTPAPVTPPDVPIDPFERILPAIRQAYTLGFRPDPDGKPHRIEVRVKKPDLSVHARQAYVAGSTDRLP